MWNRTVLRMGMIAALCLSGGVSARAASYVLVDDLSCTGAADGTFPGFLASSFSFGGETAGGFSYGGGGSAASPTPSNVTVVKNADDCSPGLFKLWATGTHVKKVTVRVLDGPKNELLRITLDDVTVVKVSYGPAAESIGFAYARLTLLHVPSGKSVTYDFKTRTVI